MSKNKSQTTNWKERRRFHAMKLKSKGWKRREIAAAIDVSEGAVSRWFKQVEEKGKESLQARPHTGRPPELTNEEKRLIPDFLGHGAEAYGFRGAVWTCPRVRKVIEWEFGVTYHRSHVARLLKELKWTPQQPIERAIQRDEVEITRWRKEIWLETKKKRVWSIESLFLWMNRAFISCLPRSDPMRHADKHQSCASSKPATICL
jgi:transposase